MPEQEPPRNTRPRPDGTDPSRYKGHENWPMRRWAWEFLRRNPRFQEACKAARTGDQARKKKVAREFDLTKFKDYVEGYTGGSGKPRFASSVPAKWSNVGKPAVKVIEAIRLQPGQVLLRFDLAAAQPHKAALSAQLREAAAYLERMLEKQRESSGMKVPPARSAQPDVFIRHLQLLDLTHKRRHKQERALALVMGLSEPVDRENFKSQIKLARKYLKDYLVIAHLEDPAKPKASRDPSMWAEQRAAGRAARAKRAA